MERAKDQADYDAAAAEVHKTVSNLHWSNQERLPMWVIFGPNTADQPGLYLARLWLTLPAPEATNVLIRAASLEEIHDLLPIGLARLERHPDDDPNIIETWI